MPSVLSINTGSQAEEGREAGRAVPAAAAGGTSNTRTLGCQSARTYFQAHRHQCHLLFGGYIKDCRDEAGEGKKSALRNKGYISTVQIKRFG